LVNRFIKARLALAVARLFMVNESFRPRRQDCFAAQPGGGAEMFDANAIASAIHRAPPAGAPNATPAQCGPAPPFPETI